MRRSLWMSPYTAGVANEITRASLSIEMKTFRASNYGSHAIFAYPEFIAIGCVRPWFNAVTFAIMIAVRWWWACGFGWACAWWCSSAVGWCWCVFGWCCCAFGCWWVKSIAIHVSGPVANLQIKYKLVKFNNDNCDRSKKETKQRLLKRLNNRCLVSFLSSFDQVSISEIKCKPQYLCLKAGNRKWSEYASYLRKLVLI